MKKPTDNQDSGILLTPGTSRRRKARKRLQDGKPVKGMTQKQVDRYLTLLIKIHYQKARKEGALTFNNVKRYLDYLAKLAGKQLTQTMMNQEKIERFSETIKPVIEEVSTKSAITNEDVEKHSNDIRHFAKQYTQELQQGTNQVTTTIADPSGPNLLPQQENSKVSSPEEKIENVEQTAIEESAVDDLLRWEIVPIGLEEGAPRISIEAFLTFPLAREEQEPNSEQAFAMHFRYLDLAVAEACLKQEDLVTIKSLVTKVPIKRYSKYFDLFPDDEYDDAQLMVIFSQWRNQTLNRFLVEDETNLE